MNKSPLKLILAAGAVAILGPGIARAADPVITDPTVTSIGVVTGGDVGEGLDLEGDFVYALSLGAEVDFSAKIRDATFLGLIDAEVPGATHEAGNRILNWYVVTYGDSANDESLKAATSSIRWSDAANANLPEMRLTLENLQIGTEYKFQMMFGEQCCNRGFDILFDDQLVVKDLNPGVVHGGIANGSQEALVTHTYTPKASKVVIRFDGREASSDYSDHNAIINAVTVEKLGVAVDTDKDGMPDAYETKYGFNPNDASDAAKDFDGDGVSNLDEFKAGTDPIDTVKPTVVSAAGSASFNTVDVTFSEEVDPATATVASNYTLTPALAVTSVTYKKKVATLTTAAQAPGGTAYTVAVKGVKDGSKNEVPAGSQAVFYSYLLTRAGALQIKVYEGITGTPIDNLYNDPKWPASPDRSGGVFSFNSRDFLPTDSLENYGASVEGFVSPPDTGKYRFFIYSDDSSQLFLSTDDKEANLVQIAEETGCCNFFTEPDSPRTSEPIDLVAGKKYFVRLVYKEGGGGDYGQVAWRKEGDATPAGSLVPIPGQFLSAAVDLPAPAEGAFTARNPAPAAKNVPPNSKITISHRDGKTEWTAANVTLKFDGNVVTPTFTKEGKVATISYNPGVLFSSKSTHSVSLGYLDAGNNPATLDYTFETAEYRGPIKDTVSSRLGLLMGKATQSAGRTGAAGDFALDTGTAAGAVSVLDISSFNTAAAKDTMSVAYFQNLTVRDASAFWMLSPKSNNGQRGFQAHAPWSNQNVYFDTAGCCTADTQRIDKNIGEQPGYTDATWWQSWHHFVFVKNQSTKQIWIDGLLFHEGLGDPLPTDFTEMVIGGGPGVADNRIAGKIDDFSVFGSALTEAQIKALAAGTLPNALSGNPTLLAYWNFNDDLSAPAAGPKLTVSRNGNTLTVTSDPQPLAAGFVLETATSVTGPWTAVAGQNTPFTTTVSAGNVFLRAIKR